MAGRVVRGKGEVRKDGAEREGGDSLVRGHVKRIESDIRGE